MFDEIKGKYYVHVNALKWLFTKVDVICMLLWKPKQRIAILLPGPYSYVNRARELKGRGRNKIAPS